MPTTETIVRVDGPRQTTSSSSSGATRSSCSAATPTAGGAFLGGRGPLDVVVTAPAGSNLLAKTASARLTADGRVDAARIRSASGEIRVEEIAGDGVFEAGSGTIEVRAAAGDLRLKAGSGDISIGRAGSGLEANLGSGSIDVGLRGRSSVDARRVRATSVSTRPPRTSRPRRRPVTSRSSRSARGAIKATTASGDVRVGVGAGIPVWTDIRTISGEIRSDLRGAGQPEPGQDRVEIYVTTSSGDVTLRELAVAPAPDPAAVTIQ